MWPFHANDLALFVTKMNKLINNECNVFHFIITISIFGERITYVLQYQLQAIIVLVAAAVLILFNQHFIIVSMEIINMSYT